MTKEKSTVPRLRFPGFTDTWKQRKLGEVAISFDYGLNSAATEYDGENKYLRITDIDDDSREFNISDLTSPEINLFGLDEYRLSIGDILFARTGASVGKSYIYRSVDGKVYFAGFLIRVKIKDTFNPDFVFQNTLTSNYERFISITSMRSGQPGVNAQEYSNYKIMFPTLPEQEAIGSFFSDLDQLITLHQRKLDDVKELKKALLQKMFPKGNGNDFPELRFPEFTDAWKQRKLGEVAVVVMGQSPDSKNYTNNPLDNILVQGNADLKNGNVEPRVWTTQITKIAEKGDIIVSVRAPVGDVAKTRYKVVLGRGVAGIKGNDFIYQTLIRMKQFGYWMKLSTGSTFESINSGDIKSSLIPLPSLPEQEAIGSFFSDLDQLITLHQRQLDHLKLLKKALLQQMFI
ncbi:restriction endonuclease subunit S [Streptococcus suis]|uniref:restriction endonuclease subunit S n=1 Tax=Streptococcus suis TaxID=1307 RepID=UPI000CF5D616|nr:restriction endonuclease subunit S [Streptococcus suis]